MEEFEVGISYASEDLAKAEELYAALVARGISCFFDRENKILLLAKNMIDVFDQLYGRQIKFYMLALLSRHYATKPWTTYERQSGQARAIRESRGYIIPIRLDDTEIPGIFTTVNGFKWPPETAESIARHVQALITALRDGDAALKGTTVYGAGGIKVPPRHTMSSIQILLERIYGDVNSQLSPDYLLGYLARSTGYLYVVLKENKHLVERDLIRPLSWLLALASKFGIDLQDAFLTTYPEICHYCLQGVCICEKTGKRPPDFIPAYKVEDEIYQKRNAILNRCHLHGEIVDFEYARKCIQTIYPKNELIWQNIGPERHFLKLAEEVAEVHEAICHCIAGKKRIDAVADELSDVLAWLLSTWDICLPKRNVDHELLAYYRGGCPVCNRQVCKCRPYGGRAQNLFDVDLLSEVAENVRKLADDLPEHRGELATLSKSLDSVLETQRDPLARLTLFQLSRKLADIRDALRRSASPLTHAPAISAILEKIKNCYNSDPQ
jgi:hypothetical protein